MAANDPILGSGSTLIDKIMSGLISQGYTTGTISDREYSRLKAKTGLSKGYTIADLYDRAGEAGRIYGDLTLPSGGTVTPQPPVTVADIVKTFWLKADDFALGSAPASFIDSGNNGVTVNRVLSPVTVAAGVGGIKEFVFGGGWFETTPWANSTRDIWAVFTPTLDGQSWAALGNNSANSHILYSGAVLYDITLGTTRIGPVSGFPSGVRFLYRVKNTSATGRLFSANGTIRAADASPFGLPAGGCVIGNGPAKTTQFVWAGKLNEMIALSESESTLANEAILKTYFATKYGLTLAAGLALNDDGLGNLSTTSTDITDDLAGNLATVSTDVFDDGNGTLTSA